MGTAGSTCARGNDDGRVYVYVCARAHARTRNSRKRVRLTSEVLPRLETSITTPDTVGMEQIRSLDDLVANLDRLELPNQVASILREPLLLHVLACAPRRAAPAIQRLADWLEQSLQDEVLRSDGSADASARAGGLFDALCRLCEFTQETSPAVEDFLVRYLPRWNGTERQAQVLQLLTRLRPCSYESLYGGILRPLQPLFYTGSVDDKARYLQCFSRLLINFASRNWAAFYANAGDAGLLTPLPRNVNYYQVMRELCLFIQQLCTLALMVRAGAYVCRGRRRRADSAPDGRRTSVMP